MSHFQLTLLRITPNPARERVHVAALHLYEEPKQAKPVYGNKNR